MHSDGRPIYRPLSAVCALPAAGTVPNLRRAQALPSADSTAEQRDGATDGGGSTRMPGAEPILERECAAESLNSMTGEVEYARRRRRGR